ncbi:TPR domain-containing protein [Pseudoalteromonas phenolica]|uniref:TPR domain-containing protein n=2 Tax=Pseudoalteromonas phenolica TaxID=161398 RepID=A0A0S2K1C5_9GAMM|nr:TPR domain-containing protein [Pseudoalteromonas phenolica]TMO55332.1 (S)-ureidoglycine aminohydrolase [Pseudoalteromonas phenolica]
MIKSEFVNLKISMKTFINLIFLFLTVPSFANSIVENKITEAEDYLTVNPAQSLILLDSIYDKERFSDEQLIRWHLIRMRAAVPTNQLDKLSESLETVFQYKHHSYFKAHLTSFLSGSGIYLRKKQFLDDAKKSLECAYKYAQNEKQRLTLTNSLALVSRQQSDYDSARLLYKKARALAVETNRESIIAMIDNNLGMIEFDVGNLKEAEAYYRKALKGYQLIDKRSGVVTASINLLFSFLLQDKLFDYQRLYSPTATLTLAFPNQSKQSLLYWVHQRYMQLQGGKVTSKIIQKLKDAYANLEDIKVKIHIYKYLADDMNISLKAPENKANQEFNRPWFVAVKQCDWVLN